MLNVSDIYVTCNTPQFTYNYYNKSSTSFYTNLEFFKNIPNTLLGFIEIPIFTYPQLKIRP